MKLPKIEAQDRLEAEQEQQYQIDESLKPVPSGPAPEIPKPPTINPEVQAAILAAKAKIESQIPPTIENIGEALSIDFTKFFFNIQNFAFRYNFFQRPFKYSHMVK